MPGHVDALSGVLFRARRFRPLWETLRVLTTSNDSSPELEPHPAAIHPARRGWQAPGVIVSLLAFGYALQVGLRLALAVGRYGPIVIADEIGYLMDGRLFGGGASGQMAGSMFYRSGYGLLISPAFLFSDDPHRVYTLVLGINALLSSAVFPLLYYFLTRTFRIEAGPAVVVSFLGALYPPLVLYSQLVLSENALYVLTLLSAVALSRLVAVRTRGQVWTWAIGCGLVTGLLYTTHGRTAPLVAILVAGLVALGLVRRDLRGPAAVGVLTAGVTLVAGQLLNNYVAARLWGETSGEGVSIIGSHLSNPDVVKNLVMVGLGQYWYFTVGTFGLFALGLCHAVCAIRSQAADGQTRGVLAMVRARVAVESDGGAIAGTYLVLATAALVALTAIFLFPPTRPDTIVYGRYAEVLLPVFLALGAYRLWMVRPARRVLVEFVAGFGVAVLGFLVFQNYHDRLIFGGISNSYTTLNLPWLSHSIDALHPRRVMAVALVCLVGLALLYRRFRAVAAIGLAGVLVFSSYSTRHLLFTHTQHAVYGLDNGDDVSVPGLDVPQDVGYDMGYYTVEGRWAFQWKLANTHFVLFNSKTGDSAPRVRYVISGKTWPEAARLGAVQVWTERYGQEAVWFIPSRPPAPLTTSATP